MIIKDAYLRNYINNFVLKLVKMFCGKYLYLFEIYKCGKISDVKNDTINFEYYYISQFAKPQVYFLFSLQLIKSETDPISKI